MSLVPCPWPQGTRDKGRGTRDKDMGQTCTRCSRVNPEDAAYCYHDGAVLAGHSRNGGPVAVGSAPFVSPFVFPSGRQCRTFDELALACQHDWDAARDLLRQGFFESFFGTLGRADLAQAAREASRFPDHDRGLDQLLNKLPSQVVESPRLFVAPQDVSLGTLNVGEDRHCELHLENRGMRLLYGSVTCDGCDWLALGEAPGAPEKIFQFGAETTIPVLVKGKRLRAGARQLEGRLAVESNGGAVTVFLRAEVPPRPFPDGPLQGALTPRQVAEKARSAPKESAAYFEKGVVAEWYKSNGWVYPVQGPSASGLGAVQQFFEALGLTPPPKVDISDRSLRWEVAAGDTVRHALQVRSEEKRPVYAHATSNAPWLEVGRPKLNGRTVLIPLVVPNVPDRAGETLTAKVVVQANGNQRFVVPITLVIGDNFQFGKAEPVVEAVLAEPPMKTPTAPEPKEAPPPTATGSPLRDRDRFSLAHLLPLAGLLVVLLGVSTFDVFSRPQGAAPEGGPDGLAAGEFDRPYPASLKDREPRIGIDFDDRRRFGFVLLKERDPDNPDRRKRLTFAEKGSTNNTCVKVDGNQYLFGNAGRGSYGTWLNKEVKRGNGRIGWDSVWEASPESIVVTQGVDLVPGEQSLLLDTVLVRYTVENRSKVPHTVGLRVMLDTFIGANDGVPFAVPGSEGKKDRLVDSMEVFDQKEIPDYIQALERPDLRDPGTVAHLGLKLPGYEDMVQMVICRWPEGGKEYKWPEKGDYEPMRSNPDKPDSCVFLFWAYDQMPPGETRKMAFTYGLNTVSGVGGGDGKLALTSGGSTRPGGEFTVTAYVKDAADGQVVKLTLPEGFSFVKGHEAEKTVETGGQLAQVSWRVRSGPREGEFTLEASSGGARATRSVRIR
ncbi:MAG TPA: hypothetical protein VFW33_08960, partial [Gemmataceae bacterium]|nr:hypothetical protein [Gemmataceae bacterium]